MLGIYWFFVYPNATFGHDWLKSRSQGEQLAIFAAATATIAFLLSALSSPLYRFLEGYLLWPRWLQDCRKHFQLARKRRLEESVAGTGWRPGFATTTTAVLLDAFSSPCFLFLNKCLPRSLQECGKNIQLTLERRLEERKESDVSSGWRRGLVLEKLALYPKNDDQVAPTRFGNALRSFETYGKTRFNLDSQSLWYELCAVAPAFIRTAVQDARSVVDFFVASTYLSALLGLVTLIIAVSEGPKLSTVIVCIFAFLMTVLCRWWAVRATTEWRYTVQALVNIGRVKLAEALGLRLPETLEDEKKMWGLVTRYGFYSKEADGISLNQFRKKPEFVAEEASENQHGAGNRERQEDNNSLKEKDDDGSEGEDC